MARTVRDANAHLVKGSTTATQSLGGDNRPFPPLPGTYVEIECTQALKPVLRLKGRRHGSTHLLECLPRDYDTSPSADAVDFKERLYS